MTPDEMLARWRELRAYGACVEFPVDFTNTVCWIWANGDDARRDGIPFSGHDPDPLKAFCEAYRAWKEAQA